VFLVGAGIGGCTPRETVTAKSQALVPTFTVGGTVSGLSGSGLVLGNAASTLAVGASGAFAFASSLPSGSAYNVVVRNQPGNPSQTCAVGNGSGTVGTANVTNISVSCTTNSFTIGGTVDVVSGAGLVLQNNGGNNLAVNTAGPFTFSTAIFSGAAYAVTVLTQPAGQTCAVTNGTGTVVAGNVTSVTLKCSFLLAGLNDPLVSQQWHLKNTGQMAFADVGGVATIDINVEPVFNLGITGSNVTVGVADTGLEIGHEDLAANVVPGGSWNFLNNSTDPTNTVADGDHGTSVSGLIAMALNNGKGGIGVAPHALLKGFNFLSMNPPTEQAFLDSLGASSTNPNSSDVFIFNQSFGIDTNTPLLVDPMDESQYLSGVTSLRSGKGAVYVKAAGNGFSSAGAVTCPGTLSCENANFDPDNTLPYQVVVGAVNADGVKASYSSAGSAIWVSAPGGEFGRNAAVFGSGAGTVLVEPAMVTTDQSGCARGYSTTTTNNGSTFDNGGAPNTSCNYTNGMNGTSSATPVTAGTIALILEAKPALTWRDVKHILASTARQIDASIAAVTVTLPNPSPASYAAEPAWTTNGAGFKFHDWYGFGMVNAQAAVAMAKSYTLGQLGTLTDTGFIASLPALNLAIPNLSATGASSSISVPSGTVSVIEAVQIRVNITHPAVGELGIELISPAGTRSVLKNIIDGYFDSADFSNQVFLSNAFYGENPSGPWTIKVVDGADINPGDTGTLTSWAIRVYGH
jgi:subtilisin-like proprotein convertase family protein/subtilisin family serine protease